jgi:hypothetical protein
MTQYDDDADRWRDDVDYEKVCYHCGVGGLHWQTVYTSDGRGEYPALFNERGRRHFCQPDPNDFQPVKD